MKKKTTHQVERYILKKEQQGDEKPRKQKKI